MALRYPAAMKLDQSAGNIALLAVCLLIGVVLGRTVFSGSGRYQVVANGPATTTVLDTTTGQTRWLVAGKTEP